MVGSIILPAENFIVEIAMEFVSEERIGSRKFALTSLAK